jgi:hypothetical protein
VQPVCGGGGSGIPAGQILTVFSRQANRVGARPHRRGQQWPRVPQVDAEVVGGDLRLAQPPEFDLMARIAGLRLRERWGGWNGEPRTATSWRHISVYERSHDRPQAGVWS